MPNAQIKYQKCLIGSLINKKNFIFIDTLKFEIILLDDNDPFENLVPDDMEKDDVNDQLTEDDSNLLLGNLIDLNKANGEEIESEEVDYGESEFNVDDILANASNSK